jgi:hypothetical protein
MVGAAPGSRGGSCVIRWVVPPRELLERSGCVRASFLNLVRTHITFLSSKCQYVLAFVLKKEYHALG